MSPFSQHFAAYHTSGARAPCQVLHWGGGVILILPVSDIYNMHI